MLSPGLNYCDPLGRKHLLAQSHRYCSGEFQVRARRHPHGRAQVVAIPPYCSGHSKDFSSLFPRVGDSCRNPTVLLRAIQRISSSYAVLGNGDVAIPPYCSGQFQGEKSSSGMYYLAQVAIPPYCSGQFQAVRNQVLRGAHILLVAIPPYCSGQFHVLGSPTTGSLCESQSHRTAQSNFKDGRRLLERHGDPLRRNPTVPAQSNSKSRRSRR